MAKISLAQVCFDSDFTYGTERRDVKMVDTWREWDSGARLKHAITGVVLAWMRHYS